MQVISFGRVTVATAGTPVRVTATATPVTALVFTSYGTGTAVRIYVGLSGMNVSTGANVLGEVYPYAATAGAPDRWVLESGANANPLDASSFYIDAGTNGGSVYVFGLQN